MSDDKIREFKQPEPKEIKFEDIKNLHELREIYGPKSKEVKKMVMNMADLFERHKITGEIDNPQLRKILRQFDDYEIFVMASEILRTDTPDFHPMIKYLTSSDWRKAREEKGSIEEEVGEETKKAPAVEAPEEERRIAA